MSKSLFLACVLVSAVALSACSQRDVSPLFSITADDLRAMVSAMPGPVQQAILARPAEFLREIAAIMKQPADCFVLVDKEHPLPEGYIPPDLIDLKGTGLAISRADLELRASILPAALAMARDAASDHVTLLYSSTYRSFAYQKLVYSREVERYGKKVADSESAVPGTSQHQLGSAVDFGCICDSFASSAAFTWLSEHAEQHGFSLSYPTGRESITGYRYEPWHWRYITVEGTTAQRDFFHDVQQYLLEFLNGQRGPLAQHAKGFDLGAGWR